MPPFNPKSESEADEADLRTRAQEDASVLYARPQMNRMKTRTFSEVRLIAQIPDPSWDSSVDVPR